MLIQEDMGIFLTDWVIEFSCGISMKSSTHDKTTPFN